MSNVPRSARSFERIEREDLRKLADATLAALDKAAKRGRRDLPNYSPKEIIAICLCQGAADHYLAHPSPKSCGVHDFDVWAFFKPQEEGVRFGNRRPVTADFGPSKFGRSPLDPPSFAGRRVDVFWRAIPQHATLLPNSSIQMYLADERTTTARELAKKSVILIWHEDFFGVVWNPKDLGRPASYDPWD
jgi:hypothetical protein